MFLRENILYKPTQKMSLILIFNKKYMADYLVLFAPFLSGMLAQAIKISLKKRNNLKLKDFFLFTYAGMPSGHSAFVVSLSVTMGLTQGWNSPIFVLALVFSILTISDALKLRRYLGQQGEAINTLVDDLSDDQFLDQKYPKMKEKVGHTKREVLAGAALGAFISCAFYFLSLYF